MSKKSKDPHYKREKEKYEHPIPSREYILQVLAEYGRPLSRAALISALDVAAPEQQEALGFRLKAMLRDGQLMKDRRNRFCLMKKINLVRGRVQGHPDGIGFFIPDDGSRDMMLSPKEMRTAMHGDVVLAWESGADRRGRPEAQIHEIVERANHTVVGRYFTEHGVGFVVPDNKRLSMDISVPLECAGEAKSNQMVLAEIMAFPSKRNQAIGKVVNILGEHMAPGMEIEVAIHAHGIPADWPDNVLEEAGAFSQKVNDTDVEGRKDFRSLPFVTIDGDDAKDLDDAVYCVAKPKGGFQLYVAIADVSHYVKPGSALDKEAHLRGNSVYFPEKVVPMLPEALSNGLCSLNPMVDRLCMVAEMAITADGKISRSRFCTGVFRSQARLTYKQVAEWLKKDKAEDAFAAIWPTVQNLKAVYDVLLAARKKRGAIDFDTSETRIVFDEQRKIDQIVPTVRTDAHRIIEECMLAANVATARFLQKHKVASMYRVHASPAEDKLDALRQFLSEWGLTLGGGKKPHPKDFAKTIQAIGDRPERQIIETVLLRSLKQAQYNEENSGHFGLAYPAYTHFTSPIRRYPDLMVHRAIAHILEHNTPEGFSYSEEAVSKIARHCSMTERRADEATREVVSWLKCEFMQGKLGQVFRGTISSVTGFGIFVELEDIYVEGLVHVTALKSDYYHFDAVGHRLVAERSGKTYRLGDSMQVLVARVDLEERKIDFEPLEDGDFNE